MKDSWDRAIGFTLSWEGGYTDNPDDPGGETNFGISKRYHPDVDIKNLTKEQATAIYKEEYWEAMGCDDLPYPMDMVVFDSAVNPGQGATHGFLAKSGDWRDIVFYRIQYFSDRSKKNGTFLRGWVNRCLALWNMVKK